MNYNEHLIENWGGYFNFAPAIEYLEYIGCCNKLQPFEICIGDDDNKNTEKPSVIITNPISPDILDGAEHIKPVEIFLGQTYSRQVNVVRVDKTVYVELDSDYEAVKLVLSMIHNLLPDCVEMNDDFIKLSKALFENNYQYIAEEYGKTESYKNYKIEKAIQEKEALKKAIANSMLGSYKTRLQNIVREKDEHLRLYDSLAKEERILNMKLSFNTDVHKETEEALEDLFTYMDATGVEYTPSSSTLNIRFYSTLDYFGEEEECEYVIQNDHSYLYNMLDIEDINSANKLFKAIFIENTAHIDVMADVSIDFITRRIDAGRSDFYTDYNSHILNPHFSYNCFDGHKRATIQYIEKGRFAEAIEQLNTAVKNFEITDIPVGERLIAALKEVPAIRIDGVEGKFKLLEAIKLMEDNKDSEK